jgi:predicted NBD/HSP70 family sugar kinase/mannose-6-phosphate isomerase class I
MAQQHTFIGLDIGGSHISSGLVHCGNTIPLQLQKTPFNAFASAQDIIHQIGQSIKNILQPETTAIGIAFPGPFNYKAGVACIARVGGKFENIFGLHIRQALMDQLPGKSLPIYFANDATCFALGAKQQFQIKNQRTLFLTLGTGFGSQFMNDGKVVANDPCLPTSGMLFDQDFLTGKADDFFSTRWLLNSYANKTGRTIPGVKELVEEEPLIAADLFKDFGTHLGQFLTPWLNKFNCQELVIGGNIAKSASMFVPWLQHQLSQSKLSVNTSICNNTEDCIVTGAAIYANENIVNTKDSAPLQPKRKTLQPLLPLTISADAKAHYNIYPSFHTQEKIQSGFDNLANIISTHSTIVIDGYGGVLWEDFRTALHKALRSINKTVCWFDVSTCLYSKAEINELLQGSMGKSDSIFGKKFKGSLADYFDKDLLTLLQPNANAAISIVYGTGASLANWQGPLIYVDLPKNEIQYRMRAGSITTLGAEHPDNPTVMYKRCYFADWPALNKHKQQLLPHINFIVDEQRIYTITWMEGNAFRRALDAMMEQPFRARPWFEAGIWGGTWMKRQLPGINIAEHNYAWSFELITPENGLVLENNHYLMEISFDFLLYNNNKKLLGKASNRFGTEFPIRFDFLDTFDGGNLSIQCHPRTEYIRQQFGESFTQDETYYILDCKPGAAVYLGFQEDINPSGFKKELQEAQNNGTALEAEKFIQKFTAHQHDLFLIPNGTIHASGKNNMVLEISSTPYIFTFKMYDWLRLDANGQPRPINIEHAFNNLYFDRKGSYVSDKLITHPSVVAEWPAGRKVQLPTHEEHFYAIDRYEFTDTIRVETNNQCHIGMLVQGDAIELITGNHKEIFSYAETFVVPAQIPSYEIKQLGATKAFVLIAYVKDNCCRQ